MPAKGSSSGRLGGSRGGSTGGARGGKRTPTKVIAAKAAVATASLPARYGYDALAAKKAKASTKNLGAEGPKKSMPKGNKKK